jgi:hypothetical protein
MQHLNKTYQIGAATVTRIDEMPLPNVVPFQLYPDLEAQTVFNGASLDPKS